MASFSSLEHHLGIIDLGSNTARLVVAQYTPDRVFKITDEVSRHVRLSERMSIDNRLHASALIRAFDTIQMFHAFCQAKDITDIIPVATAAVRDASNGADFLEQVLQATGLRFRILSGEEEAYYGALGVVNSLGMRDGLVIDIGGGSAEVSQVRDRQFIQGVTSTLGAVRLHEAYLANDPVSEDEVQRLQAAIDDVFQSQEWMSLDKRVQFAGIGGTIRALARIDRTMRGYPLGLVHGYELRLRRLERLISRLQVLPIGARTGKIPGLQSDREDIILAGATVVVQAMRRAGARKMTVCGQGLREGLLYEAFLKSTPSSLVENVRSFSVLNMARLYGYDETHTAHVAKLALSLFDQLLPVHQYGPVEREYLWAAAQLHDIGTVIDYYDHHKHSAYIILGAGLPGYSHREIIIIAQLCLYHRKSKPDPSAYASILKRDDGVLINRLASLLRLAEYLDRSRVRKVTDLRLTIFDDQALLQVMTHSSGDARVEVWEAQQNAGLFEQAFGCVLEIDEE